MGLREFAKRVDAALFENARAAAHEKKRQSAMEKPFVTALPQVNLLPEQVQDKMATTRTVRRFALGAAAIVVGISGTYMLQDHQTDEASSRLSAAQQRTAQLQAQQRLLAPYGAYAKAVQQQAGVVQATMSNEVLTSEVTTRLYRSAPTGVKIDSFMLEAGSASLDAESQTGSCQPVDVFGTSGVTSAGCVSVTGKAGSRADLSRWLKNLNADEMFTVPFVPSTTYDSTQRVFYFTAEVSLNTQAVHKNRYSDLTFLQGASR